MAYLDGTVLTKTQEILKYLISKYQKNPRELVYLGLEEFGEKEFDEILNGNTIEEKRQEITEVLELLSNIQLEKVLFIGHDEVGSKKGYIIKQYIVGEKEVNVFVEEKYFKEFIQ